MAGLNTRFHDVGFDIPKYILPWGENTIITEILKSLTKDYKFDEVILLANKRDAYFKPKLIEAIKPLGLDETNIYYIGDTSGQAHTSLIGAKLVRNKDKPLFIHNADTIIKNRDFKMMEQDLLSCEAFIDVFVANSPAYCYVKEKDGVVTDIVEKQAISPYASSGLYCFNNCHTFIDQFNSSMEKIKDRELYVSDILKNMLNENMTIKINELNHMCETTVLGTPQEYGIELAKKNLGMK